MKENAELKDKVALYERIAARNPEFANAKKMEQRRKKDLSFYQ